LVAAAKFLIAATKNIFVVPNFVAVKKTFFFRALTLYRPAMPFGNRKKYFRGSF